MEPQFAFVGRLHSRTALLLAVLIPAGCVRGSEVPLLPDSGSPRDARMESVDEPMGDGGLAALGRTRVALRQCATCHQSDDPGDGIMSGSSTPISDVSSRAVGYASNLTPDTGTGLGKWTDAEIIAAIRDGRAIRGTPMCVMPRYPEMTDAEAAAIVVYLRSLPAVTHEIERTTCVSDLDAGAMPTDASVDAQGADGPAVTDASHDAGAGTAADRDALAARSECATSWVINEVQTAGAGGAGDEFVELYNRSGCAGSLDGYELKYASGTGTTASRRWTGAGGDVLSSHAFAVIAGVGFTATSEPSGRFMGAAGVLAATAGSVGLYDPSGVLVDAVGYGVTAASLLVERTPATAPGVGESIARAPDGRDTNDNNADFALATRPTPGAANR